MVTSPVGDSPVRSSSSRHFAMSNLPILISLVTFLRAQGHSRAAKPWIPGGGNNTRTVAAHCLDLLNTPA